MLPTEDLFVHIYVLADDAITGGVVAIPPRPGPTPACTDAEVLTIALARHLLGRRSEAGWLAEVRRDWARGKPPVPAARDSRGAGRPGDRCRPVAAAPGLVRTGRVPPG